MAPRRRQLVFELTPKTCAETLHDMFFGVALNEEFAESGTFFR